MRRVEPRLWRLLLPLGGGEKESRDATVRKKRVEGERDSWMRRGALPAPVRESRFRGARLSPSSSIPHLRDIDLLEDAVRS